MTHLRHRALSYLKKIPLNKRKSLRTKLTLAFLAVSLSSLTLLLYINTRFVQSALTDEAKRGLQVAAARTADTVDGFINSNLEKIDSEAQIPIIQDFLLLPEAQRNISTQKQGASRTLRYFQSRSEWHLSYGLLDKQGKVLLDTRSLNVGLSEAHEGYFQVATEQNMPYVSPVYQVAEGQSVFYLSAPVYGRFRSQVEGVLRVENDANILQGLVAKQNNLLGPGAFAALIDEEYSYLAHGRAPEKRFQAVSALDAELALLLEGPHSFFSWQSQDGQFYQVQKIALQNGWLVVYFQPQQTFLAAAEAHQNRLLSFMLIIMLLVSAVAVWVAGWLTKPIAHLTQVAQEVGAGNLHAKAELSSQDEIGMLAATFNSMTGKLEETFNRLERANQAKSEFLSNMSHELRTPLNGILGYAQILKRSSSLSSKDQHGIDVIYQSGHHLLTLINDILDLSKIEAGKMELHPSEFKLANFLDSVVGLIQPRGNKGVDATASKKEVLFLYQADDSLPIAIKADEKRLRQVLLNLLGNAMKFTEEGHVTFRVTMIGQLEDHVRLRFEVIDTGVGMTAAQLKTIFQPFEQVGEAKQRAKGTGLGLAITRQLVHLMGSEIQVESEFGQGSRFWFGLMVPIVSAVPLSPSRTNQLIMGYQGTTRHILVVDDKKENRLVLRDLLTPLGFQISEATNGQQAVELASNLVPDLILMDLMMPIMNGFEAAKAIRQLAQIAHLPIIAVSASVGQISQKEGRLAGCDDFLAKPIDQEKLLTLIQQYLKLEWRYQVSENEQNAATDQSAEAQQESKPLIAPPTEELKELHQLTFLGKISTLRQRIAQLETQNPQYAPFAQQLLELARKFEEEEILALLEERIEGG